MTFPVSTSIGSYPITLERGALKKAGEALDLARRCMILTDENIPKKFIEEISSQCKEAHIICLPAGEESKTLSSFEAILKAMLEAGFTRTDCVIAIGGGVIGDLAGFVASAFLRGVDFYNIPTTLLSQVDSSIGGKVAVNLDGYKNMVGAFYPPKAVLIDPDTLLTLPKRQIAAGLAESIKMAMTFDAEFFSFLEENDPMESLETVIEHSLRMKKAVVEKDEKEAGLRKVLNFGHTLGHAIERESHKGKNQLLHGECVSLGMIPMTSPEIRPRLISVLEKAGLPTEWKISPEDLILDMKKDKKAAGDALTVIRVDKIGTYRMDTIPFSQFEKEVKGMRK